MVEPAKSDGSDPASASGASAAAPPSRFAALLEHRRLGLGLALLASVLTAPSLATGFHLDDYVHRFLLSDLPGADELRRAYESPFGIANGQRAENHWQVEAGYAPYWIDPDLLVSLYRPVSELSHAIDAALFAHDGLLQHLHSALWFALLILVVTALYRALHGPTTVAGLAALLYAIDHTHGFAVGWIANRNALIATALGAAALLVHHRARARDALAPTWLAGGLLLAALLAGEGAVAIAGFVLAYALFLDRPRAGTTVGGHRRAVLALAPHALALATWRVLYALHDRGARGSGLYLDPAREPLAFMQAALERVPVLLLGELLLPPAEAYVFAPPPWPAVMLAFAILIAALLLLVAWPLLRLDRHAAFWALSTALALLPAVSTHPNNRLLFFVGIGCMGLLSLLWHGVLEHAPWLPESGPRLGLTRWLLAVIIGFHLLLSPLLLPLTAVSVAFTQPARAAADVILDAAIAPPAARGRGEPRDVIVLSAPDYYYTKLARPIAALEGRTAPRRLRALSFGAVHVTALRTDARTLQLHYHGGLLREPLLELYRARSAPMPIGAQVALEGLTLEVTARTPDGHIEAVRCVFDQDLDADPFVFLAWDGEKLAPVRPPAVGGRLELAPARVRFSL